MKFLYVKQGILILNKDKIELCFSSTFQTIPSYCSQELVFFLAESSSKNIPKGYIFRCNL